jgi:hypothetical protein
VAAENWSTTYIHALDTGTHARQGLVPPSVAGAIDSQSLEAAVQVPETTHAGAMKRRPASGT